jgi:short-subunit dehydrogenase involved in D-alanine esterification of teichoic acids
LESRNAPRTRFVGEATLDKTYSKLDILINNAGVCLDLHQQPSEVNLNIIRETFEINFFGVVAITQVLLPLIHKSDAENATYSVEEGADTPVWLATLPNDGYTGGFFNSRNPIPW